MKYYFLLFLLTLIGQINAQSDQDKLEKFFKEHNITFTKVSKPSESYLKYSLSIQQAVDHKKPSGSSFSQLVILTHKGFSRPTVIETQGYGIVDADNELSQVLGSNYLNVEHRYYGKSVPDTLLWEYLTFEQEAADLHRITELFKKLYSSKWVSTGISAGGVQTILYRYYYPNDVDVSVPYVASIGTSLEDTRIYKFLDTVGTTECRQNIFDLQKFLLQYEKDAIDRVKWFCLARRLQFTTVGGIEKAFEYSILEYPFSFWQYGAGCETIPTDKTLDTYLEHLLKVSDISFFSDRAIKQLEPHYYQVACENGYYGYQVEPFKNLLHFIPTAKNPSAIFLTPRIANHKPYDSTLFVNVAAWLKSKANNFIYIYGGADPWASGRPVLSSQVNSKIFILPGSAHEEAKIQNMPPEMQMAALDLLAKFSSCKVDISALKQ